MTRPELIRKLLETHHLNVPERKQLIPPAIHVSELFDVIRHVLERESRFCSVMGTLEKHEGTRYRWSGAPRSPAISSLGIVEGGVFKGGVFFDPQTGMFYPSVDAMRYAKRPRHGVPEATEDYVTLESALQAFLCHILNAHLGQQPGTIDGIEISGLPPRKEATRTMRHRIGSVLEWLAHRLDRVLPWKRGPLFPHPSRSRRYRN
jgi:hypothetical protein